MMRKPGLEPGRVSPQDPKSPRLGLGGLRAEVQVRTTAQHIWAAASHKLQYKHEESDAVNGSRSAASGPV
jgi:ppGpp synthetase/RelA/SpoT-type nucleotidyltranferase